MNKKNILLCGALLGSMMMTSCEEPTLSSSESLNGESSSNDTTLTLDDTLFNIEKIEVAIGEIYNLRLMCKEDYQDSDFILQVEDDTIISFDEASRIKGEKLGSTSLKVIVDDTIYDTIEVNVKDDEYMAKNFTTDLGRLATTSFTVFGDSISDITHSAYPSDTFPKISRPDFWCEQLVRLGMMTMYNHAISGSTAGYCKEQIDNLAWANDITGTSVVRSLEVKANVQKSNYAFIFFGNNDITFGTEIGEIGEIDDTNYREKESFKGAYSDIINHLKEYNPNIRIVCVGLVYSTWGRGNVVAGKNQASSRAELSEVVRDIANEMNCKYIPIHDLWDGSNFTDYNPDGIHPTTDGYNLIVNRILNS